MIDTVFLMIAGFFGEFFFYLHLNINEKGSGDMLSPILFYFYIPGINIIV